MSRLVDKIFEKQMMNLENSNFELTEKWVRLHLRYSLEYSYCETLEIK